VMVFQPIVDICSGVIVGAESLARFAGGDLGPPPDVWFADAMQAGLGPELELFAVEAALAAAVELPCDLYISINLSPATLLTGKLTELVARSGWLPARLVVEVTEHVSVTDYVPLTAAIADLRARGMRLAVDDAGAGYASFRHILALTPDFIKLDRSLIEDLGYDAGRRALVRAMMTFAGEVGASVVAEGVETEAELNAARMLGVRAAQGFLTGRPMPAAEWPVAVQAKLG
jgi:EAL domain-containing protein (putative c-di-GMP-specific phosphodiesterase class I)